MRRCLISSIKKLDFLSPTIGFEYNGNRNYQSIEGGIYSLIVTIFTIVIGVLFGISFFFKLNASIVTSQVNVESSKVYAKDLPIIIGFLDRATIKEIAYHFYEVIAVVYTIEKNLTSHSYQYENVLELCDFRNKSYSNNTQIMSLISEFQNYPGYYCLKDNDDFYFENGFGEIPSTLINLQFNKCTTPGLNGCRLDLSTRMTDNNFISLKLVESYIDPKNSTSPINYKLSAVSKQSSLGLFKRVFIKVFNNNFSDDYGWILSSNNITKYQSIDASENDINQVIDKDKAQILSFTFTAPRLISVTTRSYLKLQDFLSNVGGFVSIIYVIVQKLSHSHLRLIYLYFIRGLALGNEEHDPEREQASKININSNLNKFKIMDLINSKSGGKTNQIRNYQSSQNIKNINPNQIIQDQPTFKHASQVNKSNSFQIAQNSIKAEVRMNNFVVEDNLNTDHLKQKAVEKHLTLTTDNFSYIKYLFTICTCNKEMMLKYNKQFFNIERLISISVFSKIMTFQFEE